ncbi:MAG: hypothetical protein V3U79_02080 [Dehalococcoidia bacterium]
MFLSRSRSRTKPHSVLFKQLERIAEIEDALPPSQWGACSHLGLHVEYQVMFGQIRAETLQAGSRTISYLECERAYPSGGVWEISKYEPGEWEALVQPTLQLAEWLAVWGGLYPECEPAFLSAIEGFERTGEFGLVRRQETVAKLCGRCGAEVMDIEEHVSGFHDRLHSESPLFNFLEVSTKGRISLVVTQGVGDSRQVTHVPHEFYDWTLKDSRFSAALSADLWGVIRLNGGNVAAPALPDDITSFPALAQALRTHLRMFSGSIIGVRAGEEGLAGKDDCESGRGDCAPLLGTARCHVAAGGYTDSTPQEQVGTTTQR